MQRFLQKLAAKSKDPYSRPVTVAFIGDSVTQGCFEIYATGPNSLETVYDSGAGYPEALRQMFAALCPRVPFNVINCGISGDSAPRGAARLADDVLVHQPDLVVVSFGLNDSGAGMEGLAGYTAALRDIFSRILASGADAILLTPNMMCRYVDPRLPEGLLQAVAAGAAATQNDGVLDAYMDAARAEAAAAGVPVCDCYADWKRMDAAGLDTTLLLSNHINHPTRALQRLFAARLVQTIFEA